MPIYVEIAVNIPKVSGVFHYHLPERLETEVKAGHLVTVPFGRQVVQGVVMRFVDLPAVAETRSVLELVDPEAVLTPLQLELAQVMAGENLTSLAACIGLMLPPGLSQQADMLYSLQQGRAAEGNLPGREDEVEGGEQDTDPGNSLSEAQARLVELLGRRGPLRGSQIDQALRSPKWRRTARTLVERGWLTARSVLPPPKISPKIVRTVQLACPPEQAAKAMGELSREGTKALERRQAMLGFLLREPGPVNVSWVYAESGGSLSDLRVLAEKELVALGETEVWRNPLAEYETQPIEAPILTADQAAVWEEVRAALHRTADRETNSPRPILLHGVTGSGKTEIYLRAVQETLQMGRQAIILVPEIALTPQTVRRFIGRFPGQVGLLHSGLSNGERYDTWRRARTGQLRIMVGPRSALFTPFPNLGLIVLDESHDDSYYQGDLEPHYHARQTAVAYARLAGAVCLMGSATPDITSTYRASQGEWRYLHLPNRILAHRSAVAAQLERLRREQPAPGKEPRPVVSHYRPLEAQADTIELPETCLLDMRTELYTGNRSIFSRDLQEAIAQVLDRKQQAILFLNRRGTSTYVFCRDCGESLKCPRCDLPLTYHNPQTALICHHCGYQRKVPKTCPNCRSQRIRQYGAGTARVEAEVQSLFPQARTLRWDYETTRQKGAHEVILSHFAAHRADLLIGTQMLAKGLDLPLVTLVGVVLADVGLSLPDYRAAERTFQVLTQVAGRAGRSPLGGKVILQTFMPEHYAIQAASRHDYKAFYQQELEYRRQLRYPPFTQLVRLEYRSPDPAQAERAARSLAVSIQSWIEMDERRATQMVGPAPCFFSRLAGQYRWQIILRGPDPASLLANRSLGDWRLEVNPPSLL